MANVEDVVAIAKWAIKTTRDLIPYSSNLPDPDQQVVHRRLYLDLSRTAPSKPQDRALVKELYEWKLDLSADKERYPLVDSEVWIESLNKHVKFRKLIKKVGKIPFMSHRGHGELEFVETLATRALKYGIGNCAETSAYALLLMMEYPAQGLPELPIINEKISIERITFDEEDDHTFLVLNRDPQTPLNDLKAWNEDAVICDPWSKEVYTIKEVFEKKEKKFLKLFGHIEGKFNKVSIGSPRGQNCYIGEMFNDKVHSDRWERKANLADKSWHPKRLINITARTVSSERLPPMQRSKITRPLKTAPGKLKSVADDDQIIEKIFSLQNAKSTFLKKNKIITSTHTEPELSLFFAALEEMFERINQTISRPVVMDFKNLNIEVRVVWSKGSWIVEDNNKIFNRQTENLSHYLFDLFTGNKQSEFVMWNIEFSHLPKDMGRLKSGLEDFSLEKKALFLKELDVHKRDFKNNTLLHLAIKANNLTLTRELLALNADPTARADNGDTPLSLALANGKMPLITAVLAKHPNPAQEAFHWVIKNGNNELAKKLLLTLKPEPDQLLTVALERNELTKIFNDAKLFDKPFEIPSSTAHAIFEQFKLESVGEYLSGPAYRDQDRVTIEPKFFFSPEFYEMVSQLNEGKLSRSNFFNHSTSFPQDNQKGNFFKDELDNNANFTTVSADNLSQLGWLAGLNPHQSFLKNEVIFKRLLTSIDLKEKTYILDKYNIDEYINFIAKVEIFFPKFPASYLDMIKDHIVTKHLTEDFSLSHAYKQLDNVFGTNFLKELKNKSPSAKDYSPTFFSESESTFKGLVYDVAAERQFFTDLLVYVDTISTTIDNNNTLFILDQIKNILSSKEAELINLFIDESLLDPKEIFACKQSCQCDILKLLNNAADPELDALQLDIENLTFQRSPSFRL
ncbi:MAG: ankyrin repeat domain-containing protein [Gammaproteobacteria bacterium]|nr:ankyrin repeat domain-containing protein [Gammaproteobacteria bacterium]